jgi:thiosulfate dehydrogenase [quinone] large subunit
MNRNVTAIGQPGWAHYLFNSAGSAWIWLIVRLYIGYEWFEAGLHKFTDPAWMSNGTALLGYWQNAVKIPAPPARAAITYDWFRTFLQFLIDGQTQVWFAKLIVLGELAIGIGMVVGAFVGIAAFFGALMNLNFMLAGSASTNPILFLFAVLLMMAWKVAGYYGFDRWILPAIGTPWQAGAVLGRAQPGTIAGQAARG